VVYKVVNKVVITMIIIYIYPNYLKLDVFR